MNDTRKYLFFKERVRLYRDFTLLLSKNIINYYLDKKTLSQEDDIYNHYMFCYNKTCDIYLKEEIDFKSNDYLRSYFYSYFYIQLYTSKSIPTFSELEKFWYTIFDSFRMNNKTNFEQLIEIYALFDKTLQEKINKKEKIYA